LLLGAGYKYSYLLTYFRKKDPATLSQEESSNGIHKDKGEEAAQEHMERRSGAVVKEEHL